MENGLHWRRELVALRSGFLRTSCNCSTRISSPEDPLSGSTNPTSELDGPRKESSHRALEALQRQNPARLALMKMQRHLENRQSANRPGSATECSAPSFTSHTTLNPTEFFHSPRCVPDLDHPLHLVVRAHGYKVDIVGMGLLLSRWYGTPFSCVLCMICRKEYSRSGFLVIAGCVQVIRCSRSCDATKSSHPLTVGFHGMNISEGLALRNERSVVCDELLAARPACWCFTCIEEFLGVFKSGHDSSTFSRRSFLPRRLLLVLYERRVLVTP